MSIVVVPARNEQALIGDCLRALAEQTVPSAGFEIILVLDGCTDATGLLAQEAASELGLRLRILDGPGLGAGAARAAGMDAAAERLTDLGARRGLIACTDADSRPAPDWLARQLDHVRAGAVVVAGLIELDDPEVDRLPAAVRRRRENDAHARLERVRQTDGDAGHHHFAGASLGITAETYLSVGGLEPVAALEDATFARRLDAHHVPVLRAADVRVRTSARRSGRAVRGLAVDLAVSTWFEQRRFTARQFTVEQLCRLKGATTVDVIVPAKECAATIGGVLVATIDPLRAAGLVDEVIVVDAGSSDGTARLAASAGATVLQQDQLLTDHGPALGKGDAMWRALSATDGALVCFLDGDTADPHPDHLLGLVGPLLGDDTIKLVKGSFDRALRTEGGELPHEGGRVTELMARPLLNLHEPRLAGFSQPLAGEFAARREVLEQISFPVGYGVEIAILIDALRAHGLDALAESHLGRRQNRHQSLRALGEMAYAVLVAVERRHGTHRSALGGHYLRPWEQAAIAHVAVDERPPLVRDQPADLILRGDHGPG